MTDKRITQQHHATFEGIRQLDEAGNEFWSARDLAPLLEYQQWRNFMQVIDKARQACEKSGRTVADHFADASKMVDIGSGARREVEDFRLSRYACYLIVQNGDPAKPVIANGQTYFALQTRRQELNDSEKFSRLSEDEKRLAIRNELAEHNKHLAAAAKEAGVETGLDYAIFQDHGYIGLVWRHGGKSKRSPDGASRNPGRRQAEKRLRIPPLLRSLGRSRIPLWLHPGYITGAKQKDTHFVLIWPMRRSDNTKPGRRSWRAMVRCWQIRKV